MSKFGEKIFVSKGDGGVSLTDISIKELKDTFYLNKFGNTEATAVKSERTSKNIDRIRKELSKEAPQ